MIGGRWMEFWDSDYSEPGIEQYYKRYIDKEALEYSYEQQYKLYKENKMKDDKKVEMPDKSTVLAVARKCPDAKDVLMGLFPDAFEEKEIEIKLEDGQIYKHTITGYYYLLQQDSHDWILRSFDNLHGSYLGFMTQEETVDIIKNYFSPCPHATITVKENKP